MDYKTFLHKKTQLEHGDGFEPIEIPEFLFPFQRHLVEWSIHRGRAAKWADCGLGKTPMQLVWADNVVRHTNKPVLIVAPLGVSAQTIREGEKFGFDAERSRDGRFSKKIIVTNYEMLKLFNQGDFSGVVCDESSILKNFNGKIKAQITEFMRLIPYRLLCTATAAPNDYPELGTSAEALGEMGYQDMLTRFFKQAKQEDHHGWGRAKFVMRSYAEHDFWRWICSWARACRRPSDLGFDDGDFILPPLEANEHIVEARTKRPGFLFDLPAVTLDDQRDERRRTIQERCERVAKLVNHSDSAICWGHLNDECDYLEKIIPGAVQISGSDRDEAKEEKILGFISGQFTKLVTKPKICGFGLNLQHCAHETVFPSHSFEQYYQLVRRCWRFGQKRKVRIDIVASEGEAGVTANLQAKSDKCDAMFTKLVALMNDHLMINPANNFTQKAEEPSWLSMSSHKRSMNGMRSTMATRSR